MNEDLVRRARELADKLRTLAPAEAEKIDRAVEEYLDRRRDNIKIELIETMTVEKFDGEYSQGKKPVEVVEYVRRTKI